jgi:hypothetical protein
VRFSQHWQAGVGLPVSTADATRGHPDRPQTYRLPAHIGHSAWVLNRTASLSCLLLKGDERHPALISVEDALADVFFGVLLQQWAKLTDFGSHIVPKYVLHCA